MLLKRYLPSIALTLHAHSLIPCEKLFNSTRVIKLQLILLLFCVSQTVLGKDKQLTIKRESGETKGPGEVGHRSEF